MTDRVISVRLRMEIDQARRANRELANDIRRFGSEATRAGGQVDGAVGGIVNAARGAGRAVAVAGGVAAGGVAAITASVVKGGIAYNTLEQTSRAALTTLTGSASAASRQMETLREFGKTSPFPRQIWIAAQQQLLAFGMSAEKIVPTFQAIQDAVAAAGGSGQTIAEITTILAKIQSTGRVTAEELNELGVRGIDAASLVGEAMGKTAAEVRADITSQAISGVQFLDTLTVAMGEKFAGAAAGVKETWAGAVDRVKGAVRDLGSVLATPLVDPEGGGAAVDWANAIADDLRALESRLVPVVSALRDRAEPAVDAITEKLDALGDWIRNADFEELAAQASAVAPALVGVTAGFAVMGAKSLPIVGGMVSGLRPLPIALAAAAAASPELRQALIDLLAAAAPLLQAGGQLVGLLAAGLGPVLSMVAALLQPVISVVGFLADRFADLPNAIQLVIAGFIAWKALGIGAWLVQNVAFLRTFSDQMKVHAALAAMSGQQVGTMGAAYSVAANRVNTATNSIKAAAAGLRGTVSTAASFLGGPWGAAIGLGITALTAFSMAQDDAAGSASNFTYQIDTQTGALSRSSVAELYSHIATEAKLAGDESERVSTVLQSLGLSIDDVIGYLLGEEDAIAKVNKALEADTSWTRQLENWLGHQSAAIRDQVKVQTSAAGAADRYAGATEGAANAAENAAGATAGLAGSLYGVGDAADSVATRTQQLNASMSGLFDAQFAQQKAADDFQGGLHKLKDAFASNDKAAGKSAASGDKYADSLKRQQKIIRDTQRQLEDLAEAQRKAEEEAAEAAKAARQRALDELFGKQFDTQATLDAFQAGLAQAGMDLRDKETRKKAGAFSLTGFSEGALANRERMRGLVQAAQAAIAAERNQGASAQRITQLTEDLAAQLGMSAAGWGLNTEEVKAYTDAIKSFATLANEPITVDLSGVQKDFAEQRAELQENTAEQLENARASATSAAASSGAVSAAERHTAALRGNSKSAIENREMMRGMVQAAQDELTQLHLSGVGKEELTRRGEELATQLEQEAIALGFAREDVVLYTDSVRVSAAEIARYPTLHARADVAGAMTTITNFVRGVNEQIAQIQKNISIGVTTGSEYINTTGGGHHFFADGGLFQGIGGPRDDKNLVRLSNREYVVNARDTAKNLHLLEYINSGGDVTRMPAYADGGRVDPINLRYFGHPSTGVAETFAALRNALMPSLASFTGGAAGPLQWAASQAGKPYIWGAVGPRGYDCSGFMSAITNVIQGRGPHARRFATGSFPIGDFTKGPGNFMIGSRRGNPGHMAGTLNGVNVESRGGEGVVVGKRARGAGDRLFNGNIWHLRGYADGGRVGDPPFDLLSPLGMHFEEILGSYAKGTDYVPMDGLYQLHRGEAVTTAAQNAGGNWVLEVRGDGSKASDFVIDSINKGIETGQIRLVKK